MAAKGITLLENNYVGGSSVKYWRSDGASADNIPNSLQDDTEDRRFREFRIESDGRIRLTIRNVEDPDDIDPPGSSGDLSAEFEVFGFLRITVGATTLDALMSDLGDRSEPYSGIPSNSGAFISLFNSLPTGGNQIGGSLRIDDGAGASDATLSALSITGHTISPVFARGTYSYTATVPNSAASVFLAATTNNAGAAVTGAGTRTLNAGENTIIVTVTSSNDTISRTYTIIITRSPSTPLKPTNFIVTPTAQAFRLQALVEDNGSAITKWQYKVTSASGDLASASWTDIGTASSILDFKTGDVGYAASRYFQVRAVNTLGEGEASDTANGTTDSVPLPTVSTGTINVLLYNTRLQADLHDAEVYGLVDASSFPGRASKRIWSQPMGSRFDLLVSNRHSNRHVKLVSNIFGTSAGDFAANVQKIERILYQAEQFWITEGRGGSRAYLLIQHEAVGSNPIVWEVMGGQLEVPKEFTFNVSVYDPPFYRGAQIDLFVQPFGRSPTLSEVSSGTLVNGGGVSGEVYASVVTGGEIEAPSRLIFTPVAGTTP